MFAIGSFNNWSPDAHPLTKETGGYWYSDISTATSGHKYCFRLVTGEKELSRIDLYARQVPSSVGNAVIHDPHSDWKGDDLNLSKINELVIYELYLATFDNDQDDRSNYFAAALQEWEYLQCLGVNVIEVIPMIGFAGYSSWNMRNKFRQAGTPQRFCDLEDLWRSLSFTASDV